MAVVFFTMPALEFDKYFKNSDDLKSQAASWIAMKHELKNLKIVFSDQVLKFHTELKNGIYGDRITILHHDPNDRDFSRIGRFATENKVDAIVIYCRNSRKNSISYFTNYKEIKEFNDRNKSIKIYVSMDRLFNFAY